MEEKRKGVCPAVEHSSVVVKVNNKLVNIVQIRAICNSINFNSTVAMGAGKYVFFFKYNKNKRDLDPVNYFNFQRATFAKT